MSNGHLAPRPGFVLDVDRTSPPIVFHHGEGFRLEKLPADRSRVIYPAEPLEGLADALLFYVKNMSKGKVLIDCAAAAANAGAAKGGEGEGAAAAAAADDATRL